MTVEISPTFHPLRGKHNNIGKRIRISIGITQQAELIARIQLLKNINAMSHRRNIIRILSSLL